MNTIDEMFNAFDEKKLKEQEEIEKKNQNTQRLQEKAYKVLDEIILPVIKELSAVIKQKGHKAEFKRDYDYVEFNFAPSGTYQPALLKFHHNGSGGVAIIQITNKLDADRNNKLPSEVPTETNQDWVRSRTLDFIRLVLEIN